MGNNKQRLFEIMGKVDKNFKPKLNEEAILSHEIDNIVQSYLQTALWAEGGDGSELDSKSIDDIDQNSIQGSKQDVMNFLRQAESQASDELSTYNAESLGHNLWLSRNGHGAGFFDDNNDKLQNIARNMKGADIYVGDDGKVYISGHEPSGVNEISQEHYDDAIRQSNNNIAKTYVQQPADMDAHQKALDQKSRIVSYDKPRESNPNYKPKPSDFKYTPNKTQPMDEAKFGVNRKYTHFALMKDTNKIINGWEYKGYDQAELTQFKKDYFFVDIKDMDIEPRDVKIITGKKLISMGINPFDWSSWWTQEERDKYFAQ